MMSSFEVKNFDLKWKRCLLRNADMRFENGTLHYYAWNRQKSEWSEIVANSESKQERIKYFL